jgi:flagellar basal-body rod modification protein FlgD
MSASAVNSSTSSNASSGSSSSAASTISDKWDSLGVDSFLKMLVSELSNQDPMNPTDSNAILQQVSNIKSIQSNQQLTTSLKSMTMQQNVSAGANLIGTTVTGLDGNSKTVTGKVDSVSIDGDAVKLNVGTSTIKLSNVSKIVAAGSTSASA